MGCKQVVKTNKAVGYIRVSTVGQAEHGGSLETQTASIKSLCTLKGYELTSIHQDAGISGSKMSNRPGLIAAKAAAIANHGPFVVYSLSRASRSLEDMIGLVRELRKGGADLVSITESIDMTTATGELIFNVLCAIGQFQRQITSEQTAATLARLRSEGKWIGGDVAYGFQRDGNYIVEKPDEQQILAIIKEHREAGVSLRKIPELLTQQGFKTRKNTPFSHTQIVRILERMPK